jgi:tetratricopeptide (TPR) repeat protein
MRCLREGLGPRSAADLHETLGLPEGADDRTVARALVREVARLDHERLAKGAHETDAPRESALPSPVEAADASFLGRLKADNQGEGGPSVASMGDLTTLLAVLRAGSLTQRRAAAMRIAARLGDDDLSADDKKTVQDMLEHLRDVEIALELRICRSKLSGAAGREAQKTLREVQEMAQKLATDIVRYWDGDLADEPVMQLSGDRRAQLLLHSRDLNDLVLAHVGTLIEGGAGHTDRAARREVLAAVRYAGDARLVPSFVCLLENDDGELSVEAARAISRVDDARVWPALLAAYERSALDTERISIGGALGRVGDVRAGDYVRTQLQSQDEHVCMRAIEALRTLGTPEDVPALLPFLRATDSIIVSKAAHTLGRIADVRGLSELSRLSRETSVGSLRAAAEDAAEQIRARLILRGEEAPSNSELVQLEVLRIQPPQGVPAFAVRLRALRHYMAGRFWQLVGLTNRAIARFEEAGRSRPDWAVPLLVAGMMYAARDEYAQALALFRRALDAERARVERNPLVIRAVARCFLRRSEQVQRDGRIAIARGLLDEVMALDLRRAPSSLRFEIGRRYEALRLLGAG